MGNVSSTKQESRESKVTGDNLRFVDWVGIDRLHGSSSSLSSEDSAIIDLRSDADCDDLHGSPGRKIENQQTVSNNAGVSDAAGGQSKKSRKKNKKKKSKQVVQDASVGKSSSTADIKPSSTADIDMISLMRVDSYNKNVVVIKNSPTAQQHSSSTSGELTSGVMQPVQSRKEKRRMASADHIDRSRSPLKPTAKEPTANYIANQSTRHQPPTHFEDRFQAANHQAVDPIQPQVSSTGVRFGAGPKLRYIVIDGSNIAMQ